MKYFVFSDAHGFYTILKKSLLKAGFDESNDEHMLISIGDNFDRGPENYEMFMFLKEMKQKNKIILIKGNHEDLMLQMLTSRRANYTDITNGTFGTIEQLSVALFGEGKEDMFFDAFPTLYWGLKEEGFLDLIYDMRDYYETSHFVFTHGFIPINKETYSYKNNWRNSNSGEFKDSRWLNGIQMSIYYDIKVPNKKIVIGHFHSSYGNVRKDYGLGLSPKEYRMLEFSKCEYFDIYEDDNVIALDACTVHSKQINILVVDD